MALLKSIDAMKTGSPADYWRIISTSKHLDGGSVLVTLAGYASAASRNTGMNPLLTRQIQLAKADITGAVGIHDLTTANNYALVFAKCSNPALVGKLQAGGALLDLTGATSDVAAATTKAAA